MADQNHQNNEIQAKNTKSFAQILQENIGTILIISAVIIGVGVIWGGVQNYKASNESQAMSDFFPISQKLKEKKDAFNQAKMEIENKKADKSKDKKNNTEEAASTATLATGDLDKDYGSEVQAYQNFITQKASSRAGVMAALELAELFVEYNKFTEAEAQLESIASQFNKDAFVGSLLQMRLAQIYTHNKKCDKAIGLYENILKLAESKHLHAEALLKMALCQDDLGKKQEAISNLERIEKEFSGTSSAENAAKYLRFIKVGV